MISPIISNLGILVFLPLLIALVRTPFSRGNYARQGCVRSQCHSRMLTMALYRAVLGVWLERFVCIALPDEREAGIPHECAYGRQHCLCKLVVCIADMVSCETTRIRDVDGNVAPMRYVLVQLYDSTYR